MPIPGNYLSEATSTIEPNASGWTWVTNITSLSRATGGTASDGCLQTRSLAAGEVLCRTSASVAVLPGVEYLALADASGATVPERIGIRWLEERGTVISTTWAMTTATASATWHRIAVADYAPTTAAWAQVVFSSTVAAADVLNHYDNVYFGLPKRSTGNLLSANAETHERAAGWEYTAGTNCTIGRSVPMVNWSPTFWIAGGHVATMTVTANGNSDFTCTERPVVTVGAEYEAYAYLQPPTSGNAAWIELRFYNGAGTQIQATRGVLAAPGTGWYRQRVSDVAPTGAVTASVAFGLTGATAGQILRADTVVLRQPIPFKPGTIMPLRDSDFEYGIGTWTVVSGVGTLARTTPWGTAFWNGSYSMTLASATATTTVIRSGKYKLAAQGSHRMGFIFLVAAGGWNGAWTIRYYDAGGIEVGTSSTTPGPLTTPGWWRATLDSVPPATAVEVAIEASFTATSVSSTLRIDSLVFWPVLPLYEINPHPETASVELVIRELSIGDELSITRTTPDGSVSYVRGPTGLINRTPNIDSQVVIEDHEAPLGVQIEYTIEQFNVGTASPNRFATFPTLLPAGDRNFAWLSDPAAPQRNLQVLVKTAPNWQRPVTQGVHRVVARRNPVVFSDVRGGLIGDLVIWTRSDDERRALHWLLDSGRVILWRAEQGMGIEDVYASVGQITEGRVVPQGQEPWREWTLPLTQVDMPATLGITGSAGRTWQDVLTEHATWGEVLARFKTWEDVLLNRPIGG
ncbi:hypothetical protein [Streptomyces omiyaensis]|uniref:hypothetical protein n=1 Tax=Streptomyces omiyaensis TaxID=68247 RepID=UPI0036F822A4